MQLYTNQETNIIFSMFLLFCNRTQCRGICVCVCVCVYVSPPSIIINNLHIILKFLIQFVLLKYPTPSYNFSFLPPKI
jgi:hypothetical protein